MVKMACDLFHGSKQQQNKDYYCQIHHQLSHFRKVLCAPLMFAYLFFYFLWHYLTSTGKTQHLAKYNDLAKQNLHWFPQWTLKKRSIPGESHARRFHPQSVCSVFKDSSDSAMLSRDILIHSLLLWHTHRIGQRGRNFTAPCFCARNRKKRKRG